MDIGGKRASMNDKHEILIGSINSYIYLMITQIMPHSSFPTGRYFVESEIMKITSSQAENN